MLRARLRQPRGVAGAAARGPALHLATRLPGGRRPTWPGCGSSFWGFDGRRHTGELLVHRTVADDIAQVFRVLYRVRSRRRRSGSCGARTPTPRPPATATGPAPSSAGPPQVEYFSQHAYGLAIDLSPFQNPYAKGPVVLPELASSYLDRWRVRSGMVTPDGPVVRAFARIRWEWGGAGAVPDYMHFSRNGL